MKKKYTINLSVSLILLCLIISSCGVTTKDEKEQNGSNQIQKNTTSDLSGNYQLELDSDFSEISLQINNENGFSNVLGIIDRNDFTEEEKEAFARHSIPLSEVEKFKSHFEIGIGEHRDILGKENTPEDAGNRSVLYIQTDHNESIKLKNKTVKYILRATKYQNSNILKGVFTLIITDSSNEDPLDLHATRVKMPFNNNLDISFPDQQYFGIWGGDLRGGSEYKELLSSLKNILIEQVDSQNFTVSSTRPTFILGKESFQMIISKRKMKELSKKEFPDITLEYLGNKGSYVSIKGKINSLEKFTGAISLIDSNGISKEVGWFNFFKK